jgi:hypothetical protein
VAAASPMDATRSVVARFIEDFQEKRRTFHSDQAPERWNKGDVLLLEELLEEHPHEQLADLLPMFSTAGPFGSSLSIILPPASFMPSTSCKFSSPVQNELAQLEGKQR